MAGVKISQLTESADRGYTIETVAGASRKYNLNNLALKTKFIETTATRQELKENTFYLWSSAVSSLSVTLATPTDNTIENEYKGQFTTGATVGTISFPASITWSGGEPTFNASKTYQFSIVNNIGLIVEI